MHISAAWAQALKNYPTASMKGNIDAPAKLLLAYFGDLPVSVPEQRAFFAWMARLPKDHGKKHGKNRYTSAGIGSHVAISLGRRGVVGLGLQRIGSQPQGGAAVDLVHVRNVVLGS